MEMREMNEGTSGNLVYDRVELEEHRASDQN
jgi:hypothetical protein